MRLAAFPPGKGDIPNMVRAYIHRCEKDGVRIILDQEVTLELIRKENPDVLLFDCGDISQGTPYYNMFKGEVEVTLMNEWDTMQ